MTKKEIFNSVVTTNLNTLKNHIQSTLETRFILNINNQAQYMTEDEIRELAVREFIKELAKEMNVKINQYL